MDRHIQELLSRLRDVYATHGREFTLQPGVATSVLREYESKLGFSFDPSLRALWQLSNGSDGAPWLLSGFAPFTFLPIEEAYARRFEKDAKWFDIWTGDPPEDDRQDRILPDYMEHSRWLMIGRFPGGSDRLYFDAAPTDAGEYGQLISYAHDPDGMFYVARSVADYLARCVTEQERMTNDNIEEWFEYFNVAECG